MTLNTPAGVGGPVLYADQYGAKGDGSTDDTTAINAALQAAFTAGGGKVILSPGKSYKITNTLLLKTNTTLEAYGAYIFMGAAVSAGFYMLNTYDSGITNTGYTTGWSNVRLFGGIWDAKGHTMNTGQNYNIMTLSNSRNALIKDATFRNICTYHAIDANCVAGLTVMNCRFEGFSDKTAGLTRFFSEAIQLDRGTDGTPCIDAVIANNYMGPAIDGSGAGSHGKLVGSHTDDVGQWYSNIRVTGNTIVSPINHGILASSWKDAVISNNTITGALGDGIRLSQAANNASSRITVTGNTISESAGRGIYFGGGASALWDTCTVTGNAISSSVAASNPGIEMLFVNNSTVSGNQISNSISHGMQVTDCNDLNINGNTIMNCTLSGMQTTRCSRVIIANNKLYNLGNRGIWLTNTTVRSSVMNNHIIGAGRTTTNTYGAIEFSITACTDNVIAGNRIQKFGSGNEALVPVLMAVGAAPTSTGNSVVFNSFEGWGTTAAANITANSGTFDRAIISLTEGNNATA